VGGNLKKRYYIIVLAIMLLCCNFACAEDGNYDAFVTNNDGTYSASVVVESNKVTIVRWPQGGFTLVSTEEIVDGVAKGTDSDGNPISIEVQDYY